MPSHTCNSGCTLARSSSARLCTSELIPVSRVPLISRVGGQCASCPGARPGGTRGLLAPTPARVSWRTATGSLLRMRDAITVDAVLELTAPA